LIKQKNNIQKNRPEPVGLSRMSSM